MRNKANFRMGQMEAKCGSESGLGEERVDVAGAKTKPIRRYGIVPNKANSRSWLAESRHAAVRNKANLVRQGRWIDEG